MTFEPPPRRASRDMFVTSEPFADAAVCPTSSRAFSKVACTASMIAALPKCAASWSGVAPSSRRAELTSAPWASRARWLSP